MKATDGKEATGVEAIRGNGYDKRLTSDVVSEIEEIQDQIDAINAEAQDETAPMRERIDEIKTAAHEKGLPRKELNEVLAKRRALKKIERREASLSEEQRTNFHQLELALGMLDSITSRPSATADGAGATVN